MRDGAPWDRRAASSDSPDTSHAAYVRAGRMLDRYGVAYVCRHPEILLGIIPPVDAAHRPCAVDQGYRRNGRNMYLGTFAHGRPNDEEDMLRRAIDVYRTLDEIFAREPFTRCERHPSMGHMYGNIPKEAHGMPTQYGGWYC
ncbi:MAG: hypothetical protein J5J06_15945 [Phycisphaerae bacterium]|nr:hypothetical protein [Phycisphaerae bacterium]